MSPRSLAGPRSTRGARAARALERAPARAQRGMAIGFLAMVPLLVAYEAAIDAGAPLRNAAELIVSLPLIPFGAHVDFARRIALAVCAVAAIASAYHSELGLFQRLWRVLLEGALLAAVLGPLLILMMHVSGIGVGSGALHTPMPRAVPSLTDTARLVGGAAYEEIVFRIGVQSLGFLLALRILHFLSASDRAARAGAEVVSVLAAALLFAAVHLAAFSAPLGSGGEAFDASIFTWRVFSGIMLSCIFRWRGPGVAAWTHGLFNLALVLGAGPDVFL